jgi:hypothetical protein
MPPPKPRCALFGRSARIAVTRREQQEHLVSVRGRGVWDVNVGQGVADGELHRRRVTAMLAGNCEYSCVLGPAGCVFCQSASSRSIGGCLWCIKLTGTSVAGLARRMDKG